MSITKVCRHQIGLLHLRKTLHCVIRPSVCSNIFNDGKNTINGTVIANQWRYQSNTMRKEKVRIGCASGFWGDTCVSAPQLIAGGQLDYLVFDYLSEITMSLLAAAKAKNPTMGYTPDFVQAVLAPNLKQIREKGVRIISNAGGVNPESCAEAIQKVAEQNGVSFKVATVAGDDLMPQKAQLLGKGIVEMDSKLPMPETLRSINAYLGCIGVVKALDSGADIVLTGRIVDSALVLAPLIHSFGWSMDDFDLLAAGSLAGHLVECGAQCTGGIFTDWEKVPGWDKIGFPIVECGADGSIELSKPPGTGGLISPATVSEQLVYEIGDPANYILPDVVCDFSNVRIESLKENESVKVSGARGRAPTDFYKVSSTYGDGFRATAVCCVGGPKAAAKARATAEAILKRCRWLFKRLGMEDFTKVNMQLIGTEGSYGPHAADLPEVREAVLWLAVHHSQKQALELFGREIAPAGTGMAPGLAGIVGGRPRASPVLKLFSFLYPKDQLKVSVTMDGKHEPCHIELYSGEVATQPPQSDSSKTTLTRGTNTYRLQDLAYTRSGDKGNSVNIGVIARHPNFLPYLREALTAESVAHYMAHLFEEPGVPPVHNVSRYDLPGVHGMNFLLKNALGGGGIASLRWDPQGKAVGQMLLDFELHDMPDITTLME